MYEIEKSIPIPEIVMGRKHVYPVNLMEVGDSFFISDGSNMNSMRASIRTAARRVGIKVTTRKVEGGHRCWRFE